MHPINRSAIVVVPKQPVLDWLHSVDPTSSDLTLDDLSDEPTIYLLPECEDEEGLRTCLEKVFAEIFEEEIDGWHRNRTVWPANRTFDTFCKWFDCVFHSMVVDLCDKPPSHERL